MSSRRTEIGERERGRDGSEVRLKPPEVDSWVSSTGMNQTSCSYTTLVNKWRKRRNDLVLKDLLSLRTESRNVGAMDRVTGRVSSITMHLPLYVCRPTYLLTIPHVDYVYIRVYTSLSIRVSEGDTRRLRVGTRSWKIRQLALGPSLPEEKGKGQKSTVVKVE